MKVQFLMIAEIEIEGSGTPRELEDCAEQILDAYREAASTSVGGPFPVCLRRVIDDEVAGFERNPPTVFVPPVFENDDDTPIENAGCDVDDRALGSKFCADCQEEE